MNVLGHAGSTGVTKTQFKVWDPHLQGQLGVGGVVTYASGIWAPDIPGVSNYPSNYPPVIQSGQAFMVQLDGSSNPTLEFHQADKDNTTQQLNVFNLQAQQLLPAIIYTNLLLPDTDSNWAVADGVAAGFDNKYDAGVDNNDAGKLPNVGENMALVRDVKLLSIEFRPMPKATDTLFYNLSVKQKPYALKLYARNIPANMLAKAWLIDKYLGTQTEINLYDTALYSFTPNADTNSYGNRFMLVFSLSHKPGYPPVIDTLIKRIKARIYPNPVSGRTFKLVLQNAVKGDYTININTMAGRLASTRRISYEYGKDTYTINAPANITAGSYTVQVLNSSGVVVASLPLIIAR